MNLHFGNRFIILLIGILFFVSCKFDKSLEVLTDFQIIKGMISELDTSLKCVYAVNFVDSIPDANNESIMILDSLKKIDFELIDWGRGNWENGPRVISAKMTNYKCNCIIKKYYYSVEDSKYRVEERIRCYKLIN